jgi:predicted ATPase
VFAFLSECFESGLRRALDKRGRLKELRSRNSHGPIVIEIKYKETPRTPTITYHLAIDERDGAPIVAEEWLQWRRGAHGKPFRFLDYREGKGRAISGESPDEHDRRIEIPLKSPDLLAVNALGQFEEHPRVAALRDFITGWYVSYFSADNARGQPEAGPQERLSRTGDNLPNVLQYLSEQHPARLEEIFDVLRRRVPRIERVLAEVMPDGRLLLQFKDAPFAQPILARFASDGTIKLLAYLILLYDPTPPPFIGIEEPENFLYPRLLYELGEECRIAAQRTQILVTTHSPHFVDAMKPEEVWLLYRAHEDGYARVLRASESEEVRRHGKDSYLGYLWMRNFLDALED